MSHGRITGTTGTALQKEHRMQGGTLKRLGEVVLCIGMGVIYSLLVFPRLPVSDTAFFGGDTWEYQSIAVNFAAGKGFRFGALLPFAAYHFDTADPEYYQRFMDAGANGGVFPSYRTPGYPFVLGLIYKVFGVSPRTAIAVQHGWIVLVCALLPLLGRSLLGRGGFVAGLTGGIGFYLIADDLGSTILTEALITLTLFLVLSAWAFLNRNRGATIFSGVLFGLSLAWALLVKGSMIFLPIFFLGFVAVDGPVDDDIDRRFSPGVLQLSSYRSLSTRPMPPMLQGHL